MPSKLIVLTSEEELEKKARKECREIAREIDEEAINPKGKNYVVVAPVDERQANIIKSCLTPTFWTDYSFRFEQYFGQMEIYHRLVVEINRRNLAA